MDRPADQYAALPWRRTEAGVEYLLVTSRRSRRWIFPKGSAKPDEPPAATALREAAEEAGVAGRPGGQPLGHYLALKRSGKKVLPLVVELWPVEIERLDANYAEADFRERRLVRLEEARGLLGQEDMLSLIERFHASVVG